MRHRSKEALLSVALSVVRSIVRTIKVKYDHVSGASSTHGINGKFIIHLREEILIGRQNVASCERRRLGWGVLKSSVFEMWRRVVGRVLSDVSEHRTAYKFIESEKTLVVPHLKVLRRHHFCGCWSIGIGTHSERTSVIVIIIIIIIIIIIVVVVVPKAKENFRTTAVLLQTSKNVTLTSSHIRPKFWPQIISGP